MVVAAATKHPDGETLKRTWKECPVLRFLNLPTEKIRLGGILGKESHPTNRIVAFETIVDIHLLDDDVLLA